MYFEGNLKQMKLMYYIAEGIFNVAPEVFWIDDISSNVRKWVHEQFVQSQFAATFLATHQVGYCLFSFSTSRVEWMLG